MKSWFQNGKRILENGKRTLCDDCPCGFQNCNCPTIPPYATWVNVPLDYATITDAKNAGKFYVILDGGTHTDSLNPHYNPTYIKGVNNPILKNQTPADYVYNCTIGNFTGADLGITDGVELTLGVYKIDCIIENIFHNGEIDISNLCRCSIDNIKTEQFSPVGYGYSEGRIYITGYDCDISNIETAKAAAGYDGGLITFSGHKLRINGVITGDATSGDFGSPRGGQIILSAGCASPSFNAEMSITNVIFGDGVDATTQDLGSGGGGGFGVGGAGGIPGRYLGKGSDGGYSVLCGNFTFSNIVFGKGGKGAVVSNGTIGDAGDGGYSGFGGNSSSGGGVDNSGDAGDGGALKTNVIGLTPGGRGYASDPNASDGIDGVIIPCS